MSARALPAFSFWAMRIMSGFIVSKSGGGCNSRLVSLATTKRSPMFITSLSSPSSARLKAMSKARAASSCRVNGRWSSTSPPLVARSSCDTFAASSAKSAPAFSFSSASSAFSRARSCALARSDSDSSAFMVSTLPASMALR